MATVIAVYDDETGQHIKTFMVKPKKNRNLINLWGVIVGLLLAPFVFSWI